MLQQRLCQLPFKDPCNFRSLQALSSLARSGANRENKIILPGACAALNDSFQIRGDQANIKSWVETMLRDEDGPVRVLWVQAQLGCNKVDVTRVKPYYARRRKLLRVHNSVDFNVSSDTKIQHKRVDSSKLRAKLDVQSIAHSLIYN